MLINISSNSELLVAGLASRAHRDLFAHFHLFRLGPSDPRFEASSSRIIKLIDLPFESSARTLRDKPSQSGLAAFSYHLSRFCILWVYLTPIVAF